MMLVLRSECCKDPIRQCRLLGRSLFRSFGRRLFYATLEDWVPYRGMLDLALDERRDLMVPLRLGGDRIGEFDAREGGWMAVRLVPPGDAETARDLFRSLVVELRPDQARCGPSRFAELVGPWTFRAAPRGDSLPAGVAQMPLGNGILYVAEEETAERRLAAWLAGSEEPVAGQQHIGIEEGKPAHLVPSYLKALASPSEPARPAGVLAPPIAVTSTPAQLDPDETVLGGAPPPKDLPFQGSRLEAPPATPIEAALDAGGTVIVPLPQQLRAGAASELAFDPDLTQPPVPNPLPVVPFSGTTSPERLREIAGPAVPMPSDQAGETVALPGAEEIRQAVEATRADLPLPEYAALRAALSVHGEDSAEVLAQFGLTALQRQAVQMKYFQRFRDEPALRERFETLLRDAMRKINRGPGDAR